jgi:hypothetical protein
MATKSHHRNPSADLNTHDLVLDQRDSFTKKVMQLHNIPENAGNSNFNFNNYCFTNISSGRTSQAKTYALQESELS